MNQAESMPTWDPPEEPSLVDLRLAAEIRLLGEVIAAAWLHTGPLTEAELVAVSYPRHQKAARLGSAPARLITSTVGTGQMSDAASVP